MVTVAVNCHLILITPFNKVKRMKNLVKSISILVLSVLCFYSCNTNELDLEQVTEPVQIGEIKQMQASIAEFKNVYETAPVQTRSVINDSDPNNLQIVWNAQDTIGIFPDQGFQVAFPMESGAGTQSATFTGGGWGLRTSSTYSAYYPLIGKFYLDKTQIPISFVGQTQTGNSSHEHIGTYDYMAAMNSTVNEYGTVDFNFQHLVCIIHLSITMPQAGTYTKLFLESSGNLITEGTLNLTDGTVTATKTSPIQEVKLKNLTLDGDNQVLDAYVVMKAIDLTNNTLTVKIYDNAGNIYVIDRGLGGRMFEAGAIYHATREASLSSESTGLPVVFINTPNNVAITSKDVWKEGTSISILNPDGSVDYEAEDLSIKGRGNSTWGYPKKPYALKLGSKSEILGMKKHKRWCLLANWMDRTLLRNDIAFYIAKQTGLAWTPSGKYIELILNGEHLGNYYLCEQIKVDKNRMNINEMKSTDLAGDALTGGYLMEMDIYFDEVNKFYSSTRNLPYMFKEPDEEVLQPEQLTYFQNYINTMESYLYDENWLVNREYADYMDIGSFIDWWFVYELTMNWEPNHPKSSYVYKDKLGKLNAGPVWDFDWQTFIPSAAESFAIKNAIYYGRLFDDPIFVAEVKSRWTSYKTRFDQVPDYIQSVAAIISHSNDVNIAMWPLSAHPSGLVNGDAEMSFDEAVERLTSAYTTKLSWLDNQITNM